ncbi:hypothetical protein M977_00872 [Buttiauxella gaviniae ATCC 51604]|uniref:Uncharacterized protein n=1 Tax=Buttiauxella gaviniae ATCC 51604 TaxID=1354253 RepID=A0A1B7I463_9ENTR|nr:hypothetical protein M977_00872 [Buttiauxella gaviniae ATCC 51604]
MHALSVGWSMNARILRALPGNKQLFKSKATRKVKTLFLAMFSKS